MEVLQVENVHVYESKKKKPTWDWQHQLFQPAQYLERLWVLDTFSIDFRQFCKSRSCAEKDWHFLRWHSFKCSVPKMPISKWNLRFKSPVSRTRKLCNITALPYLVLPCLALLCFALPCLFLILFLKVSITVCITFLRFSLLLRAIFLFFFISFSFGGRW